MELSLGCPFFDKLAHNWWYKDNNRRKPRTCLYNLILSLNLVLFMVCMLRLNLYINNKYICWFIFPNTDSSTTDLSNFNSIIYNLHI